LDLRELSYFSQDSVLHRMQDRAMIWVAAAPHLGGCLEYWKFGLAYSAGRAAI
jgi:hypothetical protein